MDVEDPRAPTLHELARAAGVSLQWRDYTGRDRAISDQALGRVLHALELSASTVRERAESLGAVCEIRSQPGQGTCVCIRMSLPVREGTV